MIKSFSHKGLQKYFETGSTAGINAKHAEKITKILTLLNVAESHLDMNVPGYDLHIMQKPPIKDHWAVKVSGAWRITFLFVGKEATKVDYNQYH